MNSSTCYIIDGYVRRLENRDRYNTTCTLDNKVLCFVLYSMGITLSDTCRKPTIRFIRWVIATSVG